MEEEENQNLLDQFAMHAMQGILSGILIGYKDHRGVAKSAYCQAEAMMKERERSLKE